MVKVTLEDINLDVKEGNIMYVSIDNFRFSVEEEYPYIRVELENAGEYELIDEIYDEFGILNHDELKKEAIRWLFKHVEIK